MPETVKLAGARARSTRTPAESPGAIELLGHSSVIVRIQELVRRAALGEGGVLVTAERGAAVQSIAHELHARSRNAAGPCVLVECDAGDAARVDRLLFGRPEPDAPTDLESVSSDSRVAVARGGTLFLQDVTELPSAVQARVARIARDGEVRVDGVALPLAWRLIASASPAIDAEVNAHRFRADLFRRLSATRIDLPPLRDRAEDVPALAIRLLGDICAAEGAPGRTFTQAALALVGALAWPGNLAELRGALQRAVAEATGSGEKTIQIEHLLPALELHRARAPFVPAGNLREARLRFEREYIAAVLQHHDWRLAEAARTLGIQRPNLYRKARQLGIPLARVSD
jgi:two-component system nitrogen regulation response regulator NtrX